MDELKKILLSVFPGWDGRAFSPNMRLGEIPNFDSMTAVNIMVEIEAVLGVSIEDVPLPPTLTAGRLWETVSGRQKRPP